MFYFVTLREEKLLCMIRLRIQSRENLISVERTYVIGHKIRQWEAATLRRSCKEVYIYVCINIFFFISSEAQKLMK